ncbi:hypothetical protein E3T43_07380 [Cryobacterium sp. Hh7]|uniref:hypothetical protein n=1 Tax=Cryobacterium sp. Hh7 TaxID=1259159 RepID=UPI00106D933C|nr:hypothetical protein [Cryobacterium sp. Hh7]TFD58059.1 hypothetical protein E3T43_07380 [Cryobacterium sp. Hh7]
MSKSADELKKLSPDEFRKRQLIMTCVFRSLSDAERDELTSLMVATARQPPAQPLAAQPAPPTHTTAVEARDEQS